MLREGNREMGCPDSIVTAEHEAHRSALDRMRPATALHFVWRGSDYRLIKQFRVYHFGTQQMAISLVSRNNELFRRHGKFPGALNTLLIIYLQNA